MKRDNREYNVEIELEDRSGNNWIAGLDNAIAYAEQEFGYTRVCEINVTDEEGHLYYRLRRDGPFVPSRFAHQNRVGE